MWMGYVPPLGSRISLVSGGQWSSLQVVTEEPVVAHSVVVTRGNAIIIQGKFLIEFFFSSLFPFPWSALHVPIFFSFLLSS